MMWKRAAVIPVTVFLVLSAGVGAFISEMTLHPGRKRLDERALRRMVEANPTAVVQTAEVESGGERMRGWYVVPKDDNGRSVILLHGLSDNREGVAGYARMFMKHGYRVLLPDARAHGESGGELATYGVLERDDLRRWSQWLYEHGAKCVYGFGESMGAALIVQAIAAEPRLCAVVAESTFSTFREVAYDRVTFETGIPLWMARVTGAPAVECALLYALLRYGVKLGEANPADAISQGNVPVLLVHGTRDRLIRARHSEAMARSNNGRAQAWLMDADHGGAVGADAAEFEKRVVGWFERHQAVTPHKGL